MRRNVNDMIRAVVLCGGESKRMGTDKGLLPIGTDNWVKLAFRKLEQLNIPVCVSVNAMQLPAYSHFFSPAQLVIDQTSAKGPLKGLLSVHLQHPDDDLLLLACDMTDMDTATLNALMDTTSAFPGFDYYLYEREDFMEPLCAIYTSASLKMLYQELMTDSLPGFSMHKLIKKGNYKTLPILNLNTFSNHNTATF
jgi:molybdopterin-guanine dinucleotide biosynthesis protein A